MRTVTHCCRACESHNGRDVLDLGLQPLANSFTRPEDEASERSYPLNVFVCTDCWLVQIAHTVPPEALFSEYLYFSSFSDSLLEHARSAVKSFIAEYSLNTSHLVVEIASNDGYLLRNFKEAGIPCLGVEPARNVAEVAKRHGVPTIVDFFSPSVASHIVERSRKADLILGNNVFAHVPEINSFISALKTLLKSSGRVVLEFPYLVDMVDHSEFDTIYHEHVFYFSLSALAPLFAKHGLEVFRVERIKIHGGSLRLFVGHNSRFRVETSVKEMLQNEEARGVTSESFYGSFASNVRGLKAELLNLILDLKRRSKIIAAYGASAKGTVLLNYLGLSGQEIKFVADRSCYKQGRLTPGTRIPIVHPDEILKEKPDYVLLLTWNFAEEILKQQEEYRNKGGRFIIPIPSVHVV
jgi:SAM-dependent methyltransferase